MDLGLRDKTVIVTGGGSNIGRGIVLAFAAEGATVINAEIDEQQGQKVIDEANASVGNERSILIKTDVTDWDSVQDMVKQTLHHSGRIDVLVNNAGGALPPVPFVDKSREGIETELNLNVWSGINCIRAVLPHMIDGKKGVIVNIGSDAGRFGHKDLPIYAASKGAVIALTKSLAMQLGPLGIRVNVITPGLIIPEAPHHVGTMSGWFAWGKEAFGADTQQQMAQASPLGRVGKPQDVADMALFLASERSCWITGQTFSINGGTDMP